MSQWRNKTIHKQTTIPDADPTIKSMELPHILSNQPPSTESFLNEQEDEEPVVEGFSWMGGDYYRGCKRYLKNLRAKTNIKVLNDIMAILSNPLRLTDSLIESSVNDALSLFLSVNCIDSENVPEKEETTISIDEKYLWVEGDPSLEEFTGIEGFTLESRPNIKFTIQSFKQNHDWIDSPDLEFQMTQYYIKQLNDEETKKRRYLKEDELLDFNNHFDSELENPDIISAIRKMKIDKKEEKKVPKYIPRFRLDNTKDFVDFYAYKSSTYHPEDEFDVRKVTKMNIQKYLIYQAEYYAGIFHALETDISGNQYKIDIYRAKMGTFFMQIVEAFDHAYFDDTQTYMDISTLHLFHYQFMQHFLLENYVYSFCQRINEIFVSIRDVNTYKSLKLYDRLFTSNVSLNNNFSVKIVTNPPALFSIPALEWTTIYKYLEESGEIEIHVSWKNHYQLSKNYSRCDRKTRNAKEEFKKYANIVKNQI